MSEPGKFLHEAFNDACPWAHVDQDDYAAAESAVRADERAKCMALVDALPLEVMADAHGNALLAVPASALDRIAMCLRGAR